MTEEEHIPNSSVSRERNREKSQGEMASGEDEESRRADAEGAADESLTHQLLEQTQQELKETKDHYLRALADLSNLRKRTAQERREAWERGALSILEELLPILDNFERALAAIAQENDSHSSQTNLDSLREGIFLIYNQLRETLQKRGVEPIEALGQQFDPYFHEAAGRIPTEEVEEGSVVREIQRGYRLGNRLLRPSRVIVAARPSEEGLTTEG